MVFMIFELIDMGVEGPRKYFKEINNIPDYTQILFHNAYFCFKFIDHKNSLREYELSRESSENI